MNKILAGAMCLLFMSVTSVACAASVTVPIREYNANGGAQIIGDVTATDTSHGLLLTPNLHQLSPGLHGFHIHDHPSCMNHGRAAGDHLDPQHTAKHLGPYNDAGHLGDLPALYVDQKGNATLPLLAPRLKVSDILGHAYIVHTGGDNYADVPAKLGGGGDRIACGIITQTQ